jgi:AraC-like DNA-binding protein
MTPQVKYLAGEREIFIDSSMWPIHDASGQQWHSMGIPGARMFGRYDHHSAVPPLPTHIHDNHFEISLLVKGRQTYRVGDKVYHMKGGEQFLTFPNETHDTGDNVQEKGSLFWLILSNEPVNGEWLNLKTNDALVVIEQLNALPCRHFVANPTSHLLLERAVELLKSAPTRINNLQVAALLLQYLFQTIEATATSAIPEISTQIRLALDVIAGCDDKEWITLNVLARHAGWSEAHFKTRFRQEMGMPPAEYMVRRKVDLAKKRLMSPDAQIHGVAQDLGFSSPQYFATVFKRYARLTPSQYVSSAHLGRWTGPRA